MEDKPRQQIMKHDSILKLKDFNHYFLRFIFLLFERQIYTKMERHTEEREIFHLPVHSPNDTTANAELVQSQKSGVSSGSLRCVQKSKGLVPFCPAFLGCKQGSEMEQPGFEVGPTQDASATDRSLPMVLAPNNLIIIINVNVIQLLFLNKIKYYNFLKIKLYIY